MLTLLSVLAAAAATYLIVSFLGYVIHWAIHRPWAGKAYRSHRAHHIDLYPPSDLLSDSYRNPGLNSTVWTFIVAFMPFLLLPIGMWALGWLTWVHLVAVDGIMIAVGILNDVFHDSYHTRRHWLSKVVPGHARLQQRHFVHHRNMRKNFGIFTFLFDYVFRTYKKQ